MRGLQQCESASVVRYVLCIFSFLKDMTVVRSLCPRLMVISFWYSCEISMPIHLHYLYTSIDWDGLRI